MDARRTNPDYVGVERMRALVRQLLARAIAAGLVDPALAAEDVMPAQRMVYGVVVSTVDPAEQHDLRDTVAGTLGTGTRLPPLERKADDDRG